MSYLNRVEDPRRRNAAIAATIALHALVGYGLVTGLTFTKLIERMNNPEGTFIEDVPLPPPPTPTETPKPPEDVLSYIPPEPRPPIDPTRDTLTSRETLESDQVETTLFPSAGEEFRPAPLPPPTPGFTPQRAVPRNNSANWITTDDYPRRPLVDGIEGSVGYSLVIGTTGRVSSCELTRTSGNRVLDDATCRLIASRARFEPATDETGAKVLGTFTGSVRWEIPE